MQLHIQNVTYEHQQAGAVFVVQENKAVDACSH
jgi:hypothetical protein